MQGRILIVDSAHTLLTNIRILRDKKLSRDDGDDDDAVLRLLLFQMLEQCDQTLELRVAQHFQYLTKENPQIHRSLNFKKAILKNSPKKSPLIWATF